MTLFKRAGAHRNAHMQAQRTVPWTLISIWLLASALAVVACSLNYSASRLGEEYLPVGNDAFYHARRILDTVRDPGSFYEFDRHIHAPEGSLLTWPWGYDYAMASIVRVAQWTGLGDDPMAILDWIPVLSVLISVALLIVIARQLALSNTVTLLAALCMALSPTTQLLHGVGQIDHHYVELIFVLAALAGGLIWLREPASTRATAALAIILGTAPAFHNGLFILQVPLLATLFVLWLQKQAAVPARTGMIFATALLLSTLAVLIPSLPFRLGHFEFFTLSWFHLYVAACSSVVVIVLSRFAATRKAILTVVATGFVLVIPILGHVALAGSFIAGAIVDMLPVSEMLSPLAYAKHYGAMAIVRYYSYLIWLAPITMALCAVQCWRDRSSVRLLFWVTSLSGLALLAMQIRLHYFGAFALYLPWLVVLQKSLADHPQLHKKISLIASLVLLLLYAPPLRYQLIAPMPKGNDPYIEQLQPIFTTLRDECARDPGIVLADSNVGHYIRYYSNCSVIANNFLLTPQHLAKVEQTYQLFSRSAAEVVTQAPQIKYVMVQPLDVKLERDGRLRYIFSFPNARLANELLAGNEATLPRELHLLQRVTFSDDPTVPYAKLYKIQR